MGAAGAASSKTPTWARAGLQDLFSDPATLLKQMGGLGLGGFGDVLSGFQNVPSQSIFGPMGQAAGPLGQYAAGAAQMGGPMALNAIQQAGGLFPAGAGLTGPSLQSSANLNALSPNFMQATFPFYGQLENLVGKSGSLVDQLLKSPGGPFQGQVAGAALGQLGNELPNGDIYNRAMALLKPQVRASFSDRGLGSSGAAIKGESDAASQLADQMAQQSAQNRIGLLGAGAAGEQANASMTNALASFLGQRTGALQAGIQGALGGMQAPGQIFNQFQGATGAGIQNILGGLQGLSGLNLAPLQALGAGGQSLGQALSPLSALYAGSRAPELQMLQAGAGASPLQKGFTTGLFGFGK